MPEYTADPAWCAITYDYSITNVMGDDALTFDALTRTFTFNQVDNLSLSGDVSTPYTVTVTGTSGNVVTTSGSTTFTLTLKNPCIDPAYVVINPKPLTAQDYVLYNHDGSVEFTIKDIDYTFGHADDFTSTFYNYDLYENTIYSASEMYLI